MKPFGDRTKFSRNTLYPFKSDYRTYQSASGITIAIVVVGFFLGVVTGEIMIFFSISLLISLIVFTIALVQDVKDEYLCSKQKNKFQVLITSVCGYFASKSIMIPLMYIWMLLGSMLFKTCTESHDLQGSVLVNPRSFYGESLQFILFIIVFWLLIYPQMKFDSRTMK